MAFNFLIPAAISGISSLFSSKGASKNAAAAAQASQVDIDALDAKTRDIARRNAYDSAELERQLTPEVPALRRAGNTAVLQGIGATDSERASEGMLMKMLGAGGAGQTAQSPLLRAAIARARENLALGGKLDTETQNQVTRRAASTAGAVSQGGGLGLGRDITARDLGLTSLQLQQQRLNDATRLGNAELGIEGFDNNVRYNNANNILQQIQMLQGISQGQFGRGLAAAQFGESIQKPVVGLDPGSIADITMNNANNRGAALSNKASAYGQQASNLMGLAGNLAGMYAFGKKT